MHKQLKVETIIFNRYLFWTGEMDSSLNQRYLVGNKTKIISSDLSFASVKLDYRTKHIYLITNEGKTVSMNYCGGNRSEILAKRSFHSYALDILGNSLYLRNRSSRDVLKLNLLNMTLSRLQASLNTCLLVIDGSRQPGTFYKRYTDFKKGWGRKTCLF